MTAINHEYYVSLEVAKLLKEAGFNWECRGYFDGTEFHPNGSVECTNYNSDTCKYLKVPILDVAQRWLREVKNVRVDVDSLHLLRVGGKYIVRWSKLPCTIWKDSKNGKMYDYDTYEKAQEAGIKKALEIILEKGE